MYDFFSLNFFSEHLFMSHRPAVLRSVQYGKHCTRVYSVMSLQPHVLHILPVHISIFLPNAIL